MQKENQKSSLHLFFSSENSKTHSKQKKKTILRVAMKVRETTMINVTIETSNWIENKKN